CEGGCKTWDRHQHRKESMNKLPSRADAWLGELVVNPNRSGIKHKPEKGETSGKIGEELSACELGEYGVVHHVGRKQLEINERMAEEPKEHASERHINSRDPT